MLLLGILALMPKKVDVFPTEYHSYRHISSHLLHFMVLDMLRPSATESS